jgi:hypothetical protein
MNKTIVAFGLTGIERLFQRVEHEVRRHRLDPPADDASGKEIADSAFADFRYRLTGGIVTVQLLGGQFNPGAVTPTIQPECPDCWQLAITKKRRGSPGAINPCAGIPAQGKLRRQ